MTDTLLKRNESAGCTKITWGGSSITLWDDKRIDFSTKTPWGGYVFDLYSHVGELWRYEIDLIMAKHNIVLAILDEADVYCNVWVSYND